VRRINKFALRDIGEWWDYLFSIFNVGELADCARRGAVRSDPAGEEGVVGAGGLERAPPDMV